MLKGYKYRLHPTPAQAEFLIFNICRVSGHDPISSPPLEMYRAKRLNVMLNNKKQGGDTVSQTLTVNIKLKPTKEQEVVLKSMAETFIETVNQLISDMVDAKAMLKLTSKSVCAHLPSAVKNQVIKDAQSVFRKVKKSTYKVVPVLKKSYCTWNNQNYSFDFE